jgi:BioD-like phosphotransacetylase family protein
VKQELNMAVLLVASDRAGAGKTSVALAIAALSNRSGRVANAYKPFSTADDDTDSTILARLSNSSLEGWPKNTGQDGPSVDDLTALASALSSGDIADSLNILEVPSDLGATSAARVAESLNARVVVVVQARRGLRAADLSEWSEALGERLIGVLINGVTRYMGTEATDSIAPSFDEAGIALIGMIPEDRALLSFTVDQIRSGLGGRYAVDEGDIDSPIEQFQVGCMSLDSGELRFGLYDKNAVVVRGDRPDIQMSALNASVSCLVLTGGIDPIEYISYEAGEEETPVMVVESDTLTTMSLLNDVTSLARMDTIAKVARFGELLEVHADLERVWSVL